MCKVVKGQSYCLSSLVTELYKALAGRPNPVSKSRRDSEHAAWHPKRGTGDVGMIPMPRG